ncbi:MAG: sucrase ferredoxin [Leptolyngbya sp. SIOISBB]|nr:sucrase ferredoxin [Leptolyngbya sp. SIOISBB]
MVSSPLTATYKFCSDVSKANGEDPIGSANPASAWLVIELPLPWTEERFHHDPLLQPIHDLFHELFAQDIHVAPMAIAPDREYAIPERAHLFYYRRSAQGLSPLEKQTFLVPPLQLAALAKALLCQPDEMPQFAAYQQPDDGIRDIMVCTHGNVDIACARFGQPIYAQLRNEYANDQLRVWRCSHFGGHQFAPTLMDFPSGQAWGHLEPEILPVLIKRDRPVTELRSFYRGQSGLSQFAQIVEREIWLQRGWEWLNYCKTEQAIAHDEENADWAEILIEFAAPNGLERGTYKARVEACGSVITALNSGAATTSVKQYRVSYLNQISSHRDSETLKKSV